MWSKVPVPRCLLPLPIGCSMAVSENPAGPWKRYWLALNGIKSTTVEHTSYCQLAWSIYLKDSRYTAGRSQVKVRRSREMKSEKCTDERTICGDRRGSMSCWTQEVGGFALSLVGVMWDDLAAAFQSNNWNEKVMTYILVFRSLWLHLTKFIRWPCTLNFSAVLPR